MDFLKQLFKFYINASLHVALAVYALVRITELYFNLPYKEHLNYFIFFGTITGYNFIKYAGVAKLHHLSLTKQLRAIQIFSLLSFILMCFYGYHLSFETLFLFIPFLVLTFFYSVPFLEGFKTNLRHIASLKIIIIALVWAGVTVLIPYFDVHQTLTYEVGLLVLQRFLLVFVLTLPFDIRDVNLDLESLQTLPQKFGIEKTKKVGFVFLGFCLVSEFLFDAGIDFRNTFLIIFFMLLFGLMRSTVNQSKYYASFWIESIPIFWWLLLYYI